MKNIKIDLPPCNQYDGSHDKEWAHKICAICSLWMLLKWHNPDFRVPVMDLVQRGLAIDGYLENIGWKHSAIVDLARENGLELKYAKKFFYTKEERESGLAIIDNDLTNGRPVIVSIFHSLDKSRDGHVVIIGGLMESDEGEMGYYIQDPDSSFRGHNYTITKEEFLLGWRGGLISIE